jgi:hypothetical protein
MKLVHSVRECDTDFVMNKDVVRLFGSHQLRNAHLL